MKKLLVLVVVGLLALTGLTGCAAKTYKFGTGSYTSVSGRAATAEAAGRVQVTSIYAAVLLDDAGKIVYVDIDAAENQGTFDAMGAVVAAEAAPTKKEKGADYGMKGNSAIGKEWFEQAAGLEAYLVGKTAAEVEAIKTDGEGVPVAEDLKTSISVGIDEYLDAFAKAVANAVDVK